MTTYLKFQLRKLIGYWRHTAQKTGTASEATQDPLLQGHIQGVRDGLMIAAEDADKLVAEPNGHSPS